MEMYQKLDKNYRKLKKGYLFDNGIGINNNAFEIWELCDGIHSVNDIIAEFNNKFSPETLEDKLLIASDVQQCISDLLESELIVKLNQEVS